MAGLLLTAVRQGAIDVDTRVARILRQRGVSGMLEEIGNISGDYGKRIYLQALFKSENLSRADLQRALRAMGAQISSDYEKASILKNTAVAFLDDSTLRDVFFQMIATIKSDYERRGILSALLKRRTWRHRCYRKCSSLYPPFLPIMRKRRFCWRPQTYLGDAQLRGRILEDRGDD